MGKDGQGTRSKELQAKIFKKAYFSMQVLLQISSDCKESGQKMFKLSLEQEAYSKGDQSAKVPQCADKRGAETA
jgi:hypothetical protein